MITEGQVLDIAKEALYLIIKTSAPLLLISLIVGLIVSIFQTVTSYSSVLRNDACRWMDVRKYNRLYDRIME